MALLGAALWPATSHAQDLSAARAAPAPDRAVDAALREMLSTEGDAQLTALESLVDLRDTAAVAPLIHMLFWLEPENHAAIAAAIRILAGDPADAPIGESYFDWMVWLQDKPEFAPHLLYAALLGDLYAAIDPQFSRFLRHAIPHDIRLEELVWSGQVPNAVPALDEPAALPAEAASWLTPEDLVLGAVIGGQARAYPLRIMHWHTVVNDRLGGLPVAMTFCSLTGAGQLYDARAEGQPAPLAFGPSGLLYRSTRLMFDRATDSLWSQLTGRPLVGALAGKGRGLAAYPVTQCSWAAWRARHPETSVLSDQTGQPRDYGPNGPFEAYRTSPMPAFPARAASDALPPKAFVFGLAVEGGAQAWPLDRLDDATPSLARVGLRDVVLLGDARQGVRAYASAGRHFVRDGAGLRATDGLWRSTEGALLGPEGRSLPRLPGHIAHWFAWSDAWGPALG